MSALGSAMALSIDNTAKNQITRFLERFARSKHCMDFTLEPASAMGGVQTVFGRRLVLLEINKPQRPAPRLCRAGRHQGAHAGRSR